MAEYIDEAFALIEPLPDTEAKKYLKQLVNYTIDRKY